MQTADTHAMLEKALEGKSRANLPVVYLSGPMSDRVDFNFPRFNETARKLRFLGFPVLNPADFGADPKQTWRDCLTRDLFLVGHADVVVLLDGWHDSKGACLESDTALDLGIPAMTLAEFGDQVILRFLSDGEVKARAAIDEYRQGYACVYTPATGPAFIAPRDEADAFIASANAVLDAVDDLPDDIDDLEGAIETIIDEVFGPCDDDDDESDFVLAGEEGGDDAQG